MKKKHACRSRSCVCMCFVVSCVCSYTARSRPRGSSDCRPPHVQLYNMSGALSITTMHVVQGGSLKKPIPLPVGRAVSDIEGRLHVSLAISAPLTRRLLCVPDKGIRQVSILETLMELRNSKTQQLLCPCLTELDDPEEATSIARIHSTDGVSTRAKKRNLRETLPPDITIIAPRIDVGDAVVGGFPIRVAPLRGRISSPLFMELTPENIDYLQTVAAHEMRVNPPRVASERSPPSCTRVKGLQRNEAGKRFLCRVRQDGRQRTKVFSAKRYKSMAAAEAVATEFALSFG